MEVFDAVILQRQHNSHVTRGQLWDLQSSLDLWTLSTLASLNT